MVSRPAAFMSGCVSVPEGRFVEGTLADPSLSYGGPVTSSLLSGCLLCWNRRLDKLDDVFNGVPIQRPSYTHFECRRINRIFTLVELLTLYE